MAQIEKGLHDLLLNDPSVSSLAVNRIYPVLMKEKSKQPSIVYQTISMTPVDSLDGQNALTKKRIQFDCYSTTYGEVKRLEAAVISALAGFRGTLSDGTVVQSLMLSLSVDLYEQDSLLYRVTLDFEAWYIAS